MIIGGVCVSAKFELGVDTDGKRIVDSNSHHTIKRHISYRKGSAPCGAMPCPQQLAGVSYTHKSLFCGNIEYPFPSGLYLSRVIQLTNILPPSNKILRIVTGHDQDTSKGSSKSSSHYAKEITEGMAMADAVERAVRMVCGECHNIYTCHRTRLSQVHPTPADTSHHHSKTPYFQRCYCNSMLSAEGCDTIPLASENDIDATGDSVCGNGENGTLPRTDRAHVYVVGDGVTPLSAACIALHMWPYVEPASAESWRFVSIDPLLALTTQDFIPLHVPQQTDTLAIPLDITPDMHLSVQGNILSAQGNISSDNMIASVQSSAPTVTTPFCLYKGLSQEYHVENPSYDDSNGQRDSNALSIVVACHSHAPLQEFWDRVASPKIAITMACCAQYCHLETGPNSEATQLLCEFDDFEVYSPKRRVCIYYSPSTP